MTYSVFSVNSVAKCLSVQIRQDKIYGTENSQEISNQPASAHLGQGLDMGKARGADAEAVGDVQGVGDGEVTAFTFGRFNGAVVFSPGGSHAAAGIYKMMYQRFDILQ